jgi:hypothetical protein
VTEQRRDRLAVAFPALTAEIVRLLRVDEPDSQLAATIPDLPVFGRCACSATCTNLLTAPAGSAGAVMIVLRRDGEDVIWLSLDPTGSRVTDIEVLDDSGLERGSRAGSGLWV